MAPSFPRKRPRIPRVLERSHADFRTQHAAQIARFASEYAADLITAFRESDQAIDQENGYQVWFRDDFVSTDPLAPFSGIVQAIDGQCFSVGDFLRVAERIGPQHRFHLERGAILNTNGQIISAGEFGPTHQFPLTGFLRAPQKKRRWFIGRVLGHPCPTELRGSFYGVKYGKTIIGATRNTDLASLTFSDFSD